MSRTDQPPVESNTYPLTLAAQLLDVPSVLMWQDQALYKEPGGRETTPHQDQTFWPLGDAPLVSAWIPFDPVREENGAMSYMPGSHQASANRTAKTRRVFTIVYLSADARRTGGWPDFPLDRADVAIGDVVQGEGLPRLWPPMQRRPAPPARIGGSTGPQGFKVR